MSINNPYSANFGWRVDPDGRYDRKPSPVEVRKATPEERKKYGIEEPNKISNNEMEDCTMAKMTREAVKKMMEQGMSNSQMADYYAESYPAMKKSLIMAKISMLLSDVKLVRNRKVEQPLSPVEMTAEVNSHEEHPQTVESAAAEIKELAEIVDKQVTAAARKAAEKIIYASEGEIIEYKKPVKYYIATGYPHRDRAEQLANVIKAVGGIITCEWWLNDESGDIGELAEIGRKEFQGIRDCDVLVCLMPGYQGTHTELGAAVMLGKRVIIHDSDIESDRPVVPCYYQENVKWLHGSELQLVAELLTHTA